MNEDDVCTCEKCSLYGFEDIVPQNYAELGTQVGLMVDEKQALYGDSFGRAGEILMILYPDGLYPEEYQDMLAVVRIIDKLFRVATSSDTDKESPGLDIAGYGLLMAANHGAFDEPEDAQ